MHVGRVISGVCACPGPLFVPVTVCATTRDEATGIRKLAFACKR